MFRYGHLPSSHVQSSDIVDSLTLKSWICAASITGCSGACSNYPIKIAQYKQTENNRDPAWRKPSDSFRFTVGHSCRAPQGRECRSRFIGKRGWSKKEPTSAKPKMRQRTKKAEK